MKEITVRWQVTEEHMATIEVDDDFDPEDDDLDADTLAEYEDGSSYQFTPDRSVLEITEEVTP
jgi:hypothetical protein